jgi:hypothetical protein
VQDLFISFPDILVVSLVRNNPNHTSSGGDYFLLHVAG